MNLREDLLRLAAEHRLGAEAVGHLLEAAGFNDEPRALQRQLRRGLGVLAAGLLGLGLVFWVAANWQELGRIGRFALLQGAVVVAGVAALARPAWRAPFALLALLGIGGLFAYFGQTYQTGTDAWQLFALWAVLALPMGLAVRSDVVWAPWALVALVAISLWLHAHTGHRWHLDGATLPSHLLAWAMAAAVCALFHWHLRPYTGAGVWAWRGAVCLALTLVSFTALAGLFDMRVAPHFAAGLLVVAASVAALCRRQGFDLFALCVAVLALDSLLVAGLARLVFEPRLAEPMLLLLLIGLAACGLLAANVSAALRLARRYEAQTLEGRAA